MTSAVASIPRLLEFLGVLGKTIRAVAGRRRVTIVIDLGPHLEGVIREILASEEEHVEPVAYWSRATRELISHDEEKFKTLSQLDISDTTIGTEAIMQPYAVPESMARVALRYVEQYVLAATDDGASTWQLPAPSLASTLQTGIDQASGENAQSFTDRLGVTPVRPH